MSEGIIAVVTGANRGIGLEICRQLAGRGVEVVLTARGKEAGEAAVAQLQSEGLQARFHPLEVTEAASIRALHDYLRREFGRLDILINNAGITTDDGADVLTVSLDDVRRVMETNCYGPLVLVQTLLPLLKASRQGRIINISSRMGQLGSLGPDVAAYRLSKVALNGLTLMQAAALKDTSVTANSMCPGWVRTDMGGANADKSLDEGADTAVWLAVEAPATLHGQFVAERQVIPW